MPRPRLRLVLALSLCACGNAPGSLADSGTDGTDSGFDLGGVDVADIEIEGGDVCQDDIYGVTSPERAIAVSDGASLQGLTACAAHPDYITFTPAIGATSAIVRVTSDGPVSFTVNGEAATSDEFVSVREMGETQPVNIVVSATTDSNYDIELVSEIDENRDCRQTPEEPNDSPGEAFNVEDDAFELETRVCEADDDWFRFSLPAGGVLTVEIEFTHDDGDLDATIFRHDELEDPVIESNGGEDDEFLRIGPVAEAGVYLLRVYGWEGARNAYRLTSEIVVEGEGFRAEASGTLAYQDRVFSPTGFTGELVDTPVANVRLEVVRTLDGAVVGDGVSGEGGAFSVPFFAQDAEEYVVRAVSVGTVDGFRVEVRDRTGESALYAVESEAFTGAPAITGLTLLGAADDGIGGALNIVDETNRGFAFVARYSDERSPPLSYFWQSGQSYSCGSCYSDNTIRLGGQLEDPDEYDDDIILHEFSHYMVHHYSADSSPGGSHRDRLVNPYLAYGEGLAYFLSSAIREDPTMTDNFLGEARFIDYEEVTIGGEDLDDFYGTVNGRVDGSQREEMPAAIIWDVWDGPNPDEPWDTIELGDRTIELLFEYFHDGMPVDVGVRGIELADFVNAVACELEIPSDLQPIVDDREYPFDVEEEAECAFKAGARDWSLYEEQGRLLATGDVANAVFELTVERGDREHKLQVECATTDCVLLDSVGPADTVIAIESTADEWSAASWIGPTALTELLGGRLAVGSDGPVRVYPTSAR